MRRQEQDASLARSLRDFFGSHVRVEPLTKAFSPPRKGTRNISTPDTLVFTLIVQMRVVHLKIKKLPQTPSHSSQALLGFIVFQNQCVGSSVFKLRLTASRTVTVFIITGDFFDLKSCPALKKSFGGYFVL